MSTTAPGSPPPGPWWRRWRRPRPVLPAPTPDEVAAVRARTEARRGRMPQGRRAGVLLAVAGVAVVVTMVALFAVDIVTDGAIDGSGWAVLVVGTLQWLVYTRRVRYGRQVDETVRHRLAADGTGVSPDAPAVPLLSPFERVVAVLAVGALVTSGVGLGVVAVREGGPDDRVRTAGLALICVLTLREALRVGRSAPVGTSGVLRAVDGAVRRRDLVVALFPAWFLFFFAATSFTRAEAGPFVLVPLAAAGSAVLVGVAALVRDDGWLLQDHRLTTATPPSVWLAGA